MLLPRSHLVQCDETDSEGYAPQQQNHPDVWDERGVIAPLRTGASHHIGKDGTKDDHLARQQMLHEAEVDEAVRLGDSSSNPVR
jgi:hypothetical protein